MLPQPLILPIIGLGRTGAGTGDYCGVGSSGIDTVESIAFRTCEQLGLALSAARRLASSIGDEPVWHVYL